MIQLLLGGIATYTLYQNIKSNKILEKIERKKTNSNVKRSPSGFSKPEPVSDKLCGFIIPREIQLPREIRYICPPRQYVSNKYIRLPPPMILDKNGNTWHLAELGDLYVGREVLFTRSSYTPKHVGIIEKVNKKDIHVNSVTNLGLHWNSEPMTQSPRYLFIVNLRCVYVWHNDEEYVCDSPWRWAHDGGYWRWIHI